MKRSKRHTHPRLWAREYARYYAWLAVAWDIAMTTLAGLALAILAVACIYMVFGYGH
jgi:hypothetical protein